MAKDETVAEIPQNSASPVVDGEKPTGSANGTIDFDKVKNAKTKFQEAKTLMKAEKPDYGTIVEMLDEVCDTLKTELGDLSIDTTEALFYYGSALLEQYQTTDHLVGSKAQKAIDEQATELIAEVVEDISGEPEDGTEEKAADDEMNGNEENTADEEGADDEEDEDEEDGDESMTNPEDEGSNQSDLQSLPGGGALNKEQPSTVTVSETASNVEEAAQSTTEEKEPTSHASETASSAVADTAEGDIVPELRYAWEILETARVGYEKRMVEGATLDEKLRLSEIHYKLGLCAAENGQQHLALLEAGKALEVCKEACAPTDRELAEAFFNLGCMKSMYGMLAEAAEDMKSAVSVLESCKVKVQAKMEEAKDDVPAMEKLKKDMKDLDELIPDLMTRIQDAYEDMRMGTEEAKQLLRDWLKGVAEKNGGSVAEDLKSAPVNDISHLVRRVKRTTNEEEMEPKRLKTDEVPATVTETATTANGTEPAKVEAIPSME